MPNQSTAHTYIAVIGAYERDNFGDLLFLEVSESLLKPFPVVPLSLISRDMSQIGGRTITSWSSWFDVCPDDFLPTSALVVGGEVLTCTQFDALGCDIDPSLTELFHALDTDTRTKLERAICWRISELAYIPKQTTITNSNHSPIPIALNSIGGSSIQQGSNEHATALRALKDATYVSMRDRETYGAISPHATTIQKMELNPDIVSALPLTHPNVAKNYFSTQESKEASVSQPYLLVQLNDAYITNHSSRTIAETISESAQKFGLAVLFQPAGTASGHDSLVALEEIARTTAALCSGRVPVGVQRNRNIWAQVGAIAHAACFIGTSLHGRIVASAYGRPRVSLANNKVKFYAQTWENDLDQPFDAPLDDLEASIARALNGDKNRLAAHAKLQADLALSGFNRLRSTLGIEDYHGDTFSTETRILELKEASNLNECEKLRNTAINLAHQLSITIKNEEKCRNELNNITKSKPWRTLKTMRRLGSKLLSKTTLNTRRDLR